MTTPRPEVTGPKRPVRSTEKPLSHRLVYTVPEAGRLLGLSRNGAYEAAKRGEIPTIRIGRLLLVPKYPFHRLVGLNADESTPPAESIEVAISNKTEKDLKP
jgi:excisionase family DNA binding protein